jgi:hypothetical protein
MNNSFSNSPENTSQRWSPNDLAVEQSARKSGLVAWWYRQTALPDPPANASFVRREAARKSRLLSTIIFWLLVVFILFIPASLDIPNNHYVIYADLGMLVFCVISIFFNRAQKPLIAGILLTVGFELALTMVIFTTIPFDEPSIQQYELFVFGELLGVSLLPAGSVFLVMLYNIGIISLSLLFQPHTAQFNQILQAQLVVILLRPVAVQILVASVSYMWVYSAAQAIKRADRAETIAKLEQQLDQERHELEKGIKLILDTHVAIANGNLNARAPMTQNNVLWQIARSLNMLLERLQRAAQAERELKRVTQAVNATVQVIQQAEQLHQPLSVPLTQVQEIDPLIVAIQGKTFERTQPAEYRIRSFDTSIPFPDN